MNIFPKKNISQIESIDNMVQAEHILLDRYSGLKIGKTINILNVPIVLGGKEENIHTTRSGDDQREDLVLVHGYFVGLVTYYKMLKDLSQHYRVWCLDLIGMGLSSRPDFICQSTEETIEYFVECIEQWRMKVGIEKFYLAGFSLGGYISSMYALKFPEHVMKLILLSPAGMSRPHSEEETAKILNKLPWYKRHATKFALTFWKKKMSFHRVAKKFSYLKSIALTAFLKTTKLAGEESKIMYQYIDSICQLPESTLQCFHYLLTASRGAGHLPLEDKIHELKMPCEIYYGENDWMNSEGAYRVISKDAIKGGIHIIPKAGHIMNYENPKYVSQLMISHLSTMPEQAEASERHILSKSQKFCDISESGAERILEKNFISVKA